jgi:hypothetical protein
LKRSIGSKRKLQGLNANHIQGKGVKMKEEQELHDAATLEKAEEASMPLLKRVARGPISVNCPKIPGESYCWKFENPNPTAHYDFWILVTLQRLGDMMLMSNLIPL